MEPDGDSTPARRAGQEPAWLLRAVLALVLVGLAAWLGRQAYLFLGSLP